MAAPAVGGVAATSPVARAPTAAAGGVVATSTATASASQPPVSRLEICVCVRAHEEARGRGDTLVVEALRTLLRSKVGRSSW